MSHEITEFDKQQGREMAWHGLTDVREDLSLENCWLNEWDYRATRVLGENGEKTPFYMLGVSDILEEKNEAGEVVRPALFIGTPYCSDSFKPVMNAKLIGLLKKATEGKDVVLASCGTVKARGRQFLSFQMGETYRAAGRDFVPYFNVGNGNDKTSPLWQNISTTCTVCNNTFQMNMAEAGLIMEVKKTKFSELAIGDFGQAAKAMLAGQKEFAMMLDKLALVKITEDDARGFFAGFVGNNDAPLATRGEGIVDRLFQLFKGGAGNEGQNLADVFSAITDFYTHESASGKGDESANWKNFVSSEFGTARNKKQEAWAILNMEKTRKGMISIGKKILKLTAEAAKIEQAA